MRFNKTLGGLWCALFSLSTFPIPVMAKNDSCAKDCSVYDFVIVGAGNTGCVLANRLSENGKFSVCVLEAGRDDARLPELLPEESPANVPQPGDYRWGQYIRGGLLEFKGSLLARGFGSWYFFQKEDENGPDPFRSTIYHRHAGWGGCTSHNYSIDVRNPPQNWDQWAALGLNQWSFTNIKNFYKKVENRSQVSGFVGNTPYYSTSVPLGHLGSFDPAFYGYNGMVPLLYLPGDRFSPYLNVLLGIITSGDFATYGYPNYLVDPDWPNPAAQAAGGLGLPNFTATDQNPTSTIVPPDQMAAVNTNNVYNPYGDGGFQFPPEFARLGQTGLVPLQRVSSANTYLYAAENRPNLTIKSEVLVTKLIISDEMVKGVEYLEGWNIYQTGRNPEASTAGYGGSVGDARINEVIAKKKGRLKVFATKEVILCAGVYNTPQLLMLSGIGDANELGALGIEVQKHLPGVGKHLIDNNELFVFWEISPNNTSPNIFPILSAKSTTTQPFPNFQLLTGVALNMTLETLDPFAQQSWIGTRNLPSLGVPFVRNDFSNILLDPTLPCANPVNPNIPPCFNPVIKDPQKVIGILIEQEQNNRTEGYVRLVSKNPTVPPKITFNYLQNSQDLQDWKDIMNNTVLPLMLAQIPSGYFENLLYPAPVDILKPGITNFTSMDDVDQDRLETFLKTGVGGHHAGGTCKMGLPRDPLAVVNQKGVVHGMKNLRICDNSILPITVHWPQGTLYVIGEKIAADILNSY